MPNHKKLSSPILPSVKIPIQSSPDNDIDPEWLQKKIRIAALLELLQQNLNFGYFPKQIAVTSAAPKLDSGKYPMVSCMVGGEILRMFTTLLTHTGKEKKVLCQDLMQAACETLPKLSSDELQGYSCHIGIRMGKAADQKIVGDRETLFFYGVPTSLLDLLPDSYSKSEKLRILLVIGLTHK